MQQCCTHVIPHLSKPIGCPIPALNPNGNYGLWVIMKCQCVGSSVITMSYPGGDVDGGEGCASGGKSMWSSVLSAKFCCKSRISLKKIKFIN